MEFLELLRRIGKSKIRHLIVGGIAVNLHGVVRPTKDIDLIVYLERKNLSRFLKLMTGMGYRPKVPVPAIDFADPKKRNEWIKKKNMVVFTFYHATDPTKKVIDVFVRHPLPFGPMYRRRVLVPAIDFEIPVAGIPDLIKLKRKAGRLQDRSDIRALRAVRHLRKEVDHARKKTQRKKRGV